MTKKILGGVRSWTGALILMSGSGEIAVAQAEASPVAEHVTLHIASEAMGDALNEFGQQSGLHVVLFSALGAGLVAPKLEGKFTAGEALGRLLANSGLHYKFIDSSTVAVLGKNDQALESKWTNGEEPAQLRVAQSDDPAARSLGGGLLRLARGDSGGQADTTRDPQDIGTTTSKERKTQGEGNPELEEVVVTGSHIRGVRNDTSPVMEIDHEYIERSGYSNMMQLAGSLPVNFTGGVSGASETAFFGATQFSQNLNRGTGFNLRGLGSASTLTLINGRRVAPSAEGQFVDISNIPLAAVDHVEIVTDGASAIYGADAVAGVVNIVLRRDFKGFETNLHLGGASRGGTTETELAQTYGTSWSRGNAVVTVDLHQRDPLDGRDRSFIRDTGGAPDGGPTYILPKRRAGTLIFNLNQELSDRFDFTSNILYSYERVSQSQMFTDNSILTSDPATSQGSALFALGYKPFRDWRFELNGSFSRAATNTDLTNVDVTTGEVLFLIDNYYDRFNVWSGDLRGDGSLFDLPGGTVKLAVGTTYRHDSLNSTRDRVVPARGFQVRARDKRNVSSAYAELFVPIVGEGQGIRGARRIELSLAGRYDRYSDFGSTSNPKFGLVWSPVEKLDVRATYGTSFRAPTVAEKALGSRGEAIFTDVLDGPAGGQVPLFFLLGSAKLTAEKSRDQAIGLTFRPWPGAELSFNYFDIDYRGRISQPPFEEDALLNRNKFGSLIADLADDAAAQAFLDQRLAAGDLYNDFAGTGATGVRYVFDLRQKNAARTRTSGYDVTTSYSMPVAADTVDLGLNLTHTNKILNSLTATTTTFDEVNTFQQPLKTRVRGTATWLHGRWNSTAAVNYSNSYTDNAVAPNLHVKAWTTVDLNLGYEFANRCKAFLTATNLFDKDPPFAPDPLFGMGYDVANGDPLGRFLSARISKQW